MWIGPRYDLHRHLGGSISAQTVAQIASKSGIKNITLEEAENKMVCNSTNIGFKSFLDKFKILDIIPWPDWAIELAIEQICRDLNSERIDYTEISLSINKYTTQWTPMDAIKLINELFNIYSNKTKVMLLLSLRYDSSADKQIEYANLIDDSIVQEIFCGIDLVGDENYFDVDFYKPIIDKWKYHNKIIRAHVGEMPGTEKHTKQAIRDLGVTRVAHGIYSDIDTLKYAADNNICFDLALHSNIITGVVKDIKQHPIKKMLKHNCKITLNTDDPIQFKCTLDDEFKLAIRSGLISKEIAPSLVSNAVEASHHSN